MTMTVEDETVRKLTQALVKELQEKVYEEVKVTHKGFDYSIKFQGNFGYSPFLIVNDKEIPLNSDIEQISTIISLITTHDPSILDAISFVYTITRATGKWIHVLSYNFANKCPYFEAYCSDWMKGITNDETPIE